MRREVPQSFLDLYAEIASRHDHVEEIEPGEWVATVAGLNGVYGEGSTPSEARADLREAIIDWVIVMRRFGVAVPAVEGLAL